MENINNPFVLAPLTALLVSQIIKFAYNGFNGEINPKDLLALEGASTSRLAVAVALAIASFTVGGFRSAAFGIASVLLGYILYEIFVTDRRIYDQRSAVYELNSGKSDNIQMPIKQSNKAHITGVITGAFLALLLTFSHWSDEVSWLFDRPGSQEANTGFIILGVLTAGSILLMIRLRKKDMRKLPTSRSLQRVMRLSITIPGVLGLLFMLLQRETIRFFDDRIYGIVIYLWIIGGTYWAYKTVYKKARENLREESVHFKKEKKSKKNRSKSKRSKRRK